MGISISGKKIEPTSEISSYEAVDLGLYHTDTKSAQDLVRQNPPTNAFASIRRHHHVYRYWSWETGSVLVAAGTIAAIYSILSRYDGQEVPEWPFSINLNTLIGKYQKHVVSGSYSVFSGIFGYLKVNTFS